MENAKSNIVVFTYNIIYAADVNGIVFDREDVGISMPGDCKGIGTGIRSEVAEGSV